MAYKVIIKDKNPSNPGDIISILYKKVGSAKIFQHLLDIYNDGKEIPKINKNDINLEKKEKLPNNNNIFPPNSSIEEENPQINIDINAQNNANNYTEIIIESESEKEDQNANIIALDENEINPFGIENRSKSFSRKGKKNKQNKKASTSIHKNGVRSEIKLKKINKKSGKKKHKKLGPHYILENNCFYKFRVDKLDKEKKFAIYICDDPNCQAFGNFSIKDKSFILLRGHNVPNNRHIYNEKINTKDKEIYDFLKDHNFNDLTLT